VGQRGPIGKDPERRAGHRSRDEKQAHENVAPKVALVRIPAASRTWSASAKRWYQSLRDSAISERYEPSDWALAHRTADLMTKSDKSDEVNASVERVIQQNMSLLLTSIGDRRRQQLEVRRTGGAAKSGANVTPIETAPGYDRGDLFG
jgi:hypothetical protein